MDQFPMMQYLLDPQLLMVLVVVLPLAFWAGWGTRIRHLAAGSVVCVLLFIAGIIAGNSYGYLLNAIGMLLCTVMPRERTYWSLVAATPAMTVWAPPSGRAASTLSSLR